MRNYLTGKERLLVAALAFILPFSFAKAEVREDGKTGQQGWYVGVEGGMPFGFSTFSSFGHDKTRLGWAAGLYGGYRFNSIFSAELSAKYGGQTNGGATLTACYATGNVTLEIDPRKNIAGGSLVGFNGGNGVRACYATGNVTSTGSSTGNVHIGGFLGDNYTYLTACYWKNNHEQGIGYNNKSTKATKVDGTGVTWKNAVDAMNTALQNAGSEWRYELKGALPTLRKQ